MASREWTQEQRERAADDFSGTMMWTQNRTVTIVLPCGDRVHITEAELNTQCELNRLQEQVNEALVIIEQYPKAVRGLLAGRPVRNVPHLEAASEKWLEATK